MEDYINYLKLQSVPMSKTIVDELNLVRTADGSHFILSDIAIMKDLSDNPNKYTEFVQSQVAQLGYLNGSTDYTERIMDDSELFDSLKPRSVQTMSEKQDYENYVKSNIANDLDKHKFDTHVNEIQSKLNKIMEKWDDSPSD